MNKGVLKSLAVLAAACIGYGILEYKAYKLLKKKRDNELRHAILEGKSDLVEYLIEKNECKYDLYNKESILFSALAVGHLKIFKYLVSHPKLQMKYSILYKAAMDNKLETIAHFTDESEREILLGEDKLFEKGMFLNSRYFILIIAAAHNHLGIIQYLVGKGVRDFKDYALLSAQANNHKEVVEYLKSLKIV